MNMHESFDTEERFEKIVPTITYGQRIRTILADELKYKLMFSLARIPGLGFFHKIANQPRDRVYHTDPVFLNRFYNAEYGTADKPMALLDMPWDYIEEHQEEIPFFGLREYWYPALQSGELLHNEPKATEICGDKIVFWRDAEGNPQAIENRCPHRNPLMSLGAVNAVGQGNITCRYHGMTFDGKGNLVAYLGDGPNSQYCGKIKARSYPAEERGGIIWVYVGCKEGDEVPPLESSIPNADDLLDGDVSYIFKTEVNFSFLNMLDNAADMSHVGCLHRTCTPFGDQKVGGDVGVEDLEDGSIHAFIKDMSGHAGPNHINEIRWYAPNIVYHGPELFEGGVNGACFWFVPIDAGRFNAWQIGNFNAKKMGWLKARIFRAVFKIAFKWAHYLPQPACYDGGDGPIQMAQGKVANWDQEMLTGLDRGVVATRERMKKLHREEVAMRKERGLPPLEHPVGKSGELTPKKKYR
ncbi:MAG: hypothetical protein CMF31_00275 [Kordiimonas sp.]|nr:hypothetical protein [Kordiimonas sp.]